MIDVNKNLIVIDGKETFCIDGQKGTFVWKKEFDEKVEDALLTNEKDKLLFRMKEEWTCLPLPMAKVPMVKNCLRSKALVMDSAHTIKTIMC